MESVTGQLDPDGVTAPPEPGLADGQTDDDLAQRYQSMLDGVEGAISEAELAGEDQWVFLTDPGWQAAGENDEPPPEAVVGGWFIEADGTKGYFRPNPDYAPSAPDLPTDPVDAVLQLVVHGDADGDQLLEATKEIILGVAVDEEGFALVAPAPDDVPSVLATTAPRHRERVNAPQWREVTIEELAVALPKDGVDVLLNPGAPASMRILAEVLKDFVGVHEDMAAGDSGESAETPATGEETDAIPVMSEGLSHAGAADATALPTGAPGVGEA